MIKFMDFATGLLIQQIVLSRALFALAKAHPRDKGEGHDRTEPCA